MRKLVMLAVFGCLSATQVVAESTVVVSCFRGPWNDVIWDRANPEFTDSLIKVGYSYSTAVAIGERICRDPGLVDNKEGLRTAMTRILQETPKDG